MLRFHRLDAGSREWTDAIQDYEEQTVFQTRPWVAFIAETQEAEPVVAAIKDERRIVGYFVGLIIRRFGFRILGSPFPGWTTSYMGLCLSRDVPRGRAFDALVAFAFEELGCHHLEILDRNLTLSDLREHAHEFRSYLGFQIDLRSDENTLLDNMTSACRRCIRKAEKSGVVIEEVSDVGFADEYCGQLTDVFAKQRLVPTYGPDRVRKLIEHVYPTGMLLLLRACSPDGHRIATGIFPAWNGTMYFWGGASWREHQHFRPNEAIQWYAIRYWKRRGMLTYDMGGGGEYKRKYGGTEISVPWIRISKYPWIRPMRRIGQNFVSWRQRFLAQAS